MLRRLLARWSDTRTRWAELLDIVRDGTRDPWNPPEFIDDEPDQPDTTATSKLPPCCAGDPDAWARIWDIDATHERLAVEIRHAARDSPDTAPGSPDTAHGREPMADQRASTPEEVVMAMQQARIAELEEALAEIARRTLQRDLNQLAHETLGHRPTPHTLDLLAGDPRD